MDVFCERSLISLQPNVLNIGLYLFVKEHIPAISQQFLEYFSTLDKCSDPFCKFGSLKILGGLKNPFRWQFQDQVDWYRITRDKTDKKTYIQKL